MGSRNEPRRGEVVSSILINYFLLLFAISFDTADICMYILIHSDVYTF